MIRTYALLVFACGFLALSLVSCGRNTNSDSNPPANPNSDKIDKKTYSTTKDVWKADSTAGCGSDSITPDPTETYGIDLDQNYYWEVTRTVEDSNNCVI